MATATLTPAGPIPADPRPPASSPAQDHVRRLHASGDTYTGIAAAAGLAPTTVRDLATGRRPATPYTTTALLAVTTAVPPRTPVDAGGTRLRLRALHVMGHGSARIARAAGAHPKTIRKLLRGDTATITPRLREAITAVYEAWWDKSAPERTRFERGAATAARKRAMAGDWCAAAALDDDLLDIPGYQPSWGWKPAAGTGTAPDICPPARHHQAKEGHMTDDQRLTWGFILEVLDVMERHGYRRSDHQHTGHAIGLIRDAARTYDGTRDATPGPYVVVPSSPPTTPQLPGPAGQNARIVSAAEAKTLLAALDEAAEYKRDRAATCADCADQSCVTCRWRLQAAEAYDTLAAQLTETAQASPTATASSPESSSQPQPAADREAGQ
jgi:hypothetical protein